MLIELLAALLSGAAISPTVAPGDEIVIEGQRPSTEAEVHKAVQAISASSSSSQLARFHQPVCPLVLGTPTAAATQLQDELRSIAQSAGASVQTGACTGNLIVIVADDTRAMFSDIRRNRKEWLAGLSPAELKQLNAHDGPVRAWSSTTLRNEDGALTKDKTNAEMQTMQVRSASFLNRPTRQQIDGAVIIIDRAAARGRSVAEIAGYAAMRGLAVTRAPQPGAVSSILNLFTPASRDGARQLTPFDLGYLKGLYAGDGGGDAAAARSRIARAVLASRATD